MPDAWSSTAGAGSELAGTPIGGYDLLIAAQAMALDHTLVTGNDKGFARIEGLRVENWLRE